MSRHDRKIADWNIKHQLKQKEARHDHILSNMHLIRKSGLRGLLCRVEVVERDPIAYKPSLVDGYLAFLLLVFNQRRFSISVMLRAVMCHRDYVYPHFCMCRSVNLLMYKGTILPMLTNLVNILKFEVTYL